MIRLAGTNRNYGSFSRAALATVATLSLAACDGSGFGSDGKGSGESPAPTGNAAPVISGNPLSVAAVNQPYSFKPQAYDPNGDVLIFEISRKPSWATFDPSTGTLAGTPPVGTTGTTSDIRVSVTDGELKSELPPFSITIAANAPPTVTSITLAWSVPTQNSDGSALTDLVGYRIRYGTDAGNLDTSREIGNAATTSVLIDGLTTGTTWYFSMQSINGNGVASTPTDVVGAAL